MRRQPRWRPAWFVDVERDGLLLPIHIRGDRKSDIMPFPELAREAAIMEVLEEHGIPVPHIYGVCPDPEAIIMAAIPGSRDVSTAGDDAERQSVARQYVEAMAAMHRSEEHTSELQSLMRISYAVFCLKKKTPKYQRH